MLTTLANLLNHLSNITFVYDHSVVTPTRKKRLPRKLPDNDCQLESQSEIQTRLSTQPNNWGLNGQEEQIKDAMRTAVDGATQDFSSHESQKRLISSTFDRCTPDPSPWMPQTAKRANATLTGQKPAKWKLLRPSTTGAIFTK